MNHKTIALWAILMFFVFGLTVVVYPLIFSPTERNAPLRPVEASRR